MRYVQRTLLGAAIALSFVTVAVVLVKQGVAEPATWATIAAALAVLAAVASAWTGQRVLEMQEDALEPSLLPCIDVRSRTNVAQFKVTNYGGSHAYDVSIQWDRPLPTLNGELKLAETPIAMIPKGESASALVNSSHEFFKKNSDTTFTGTIRYKNRRGKRFSEEFMVTGEHERNAMVLVTDEQEVQQDIEKSRKALEAIAASLKKARFSE